METIRKPGAGGSTSRSVPRPLGWAAERSRRRRIVKAALGGAGGLLSISIAIALYVVDALTRASRLNAFDNYTFTPFELEVPSEDVAIPVVGNSPLSGWWLPRPESNRVVVICYGYRNRKWEMLGIGAALWRRGYNVLLFDYHGHGAHAGTRVTLGYRERDDALAAIDFAQQRVRGARLGVIGFSMGGAIAIMAAARDPRILAVVADSSFAEQRNPVRKRVHRSLHLSRAGSPLLFLADQFLYRLLGYHFRDVEPIRDIKQLGERPILLIHGTEDSIVDYHDSEALYDAAPGPKQIWLVPHVDHCGAYFLDRPAYVERIYSFFENTLGEFEPEITLTISMHQSSTPA
jgi:fermentation-respiration switch protein FrsA (DUF1100 family)